MVVLRCGSGSFAVLFMMACFAIPAYGADDIASAAGNGIAKLIETGVLGIFCVILIVAVIYLAKENKRINKERLEDMEKWSGVVETNTGAIHDVADSVTNLQTKVDTLEGGINNFLSTWMNHLMNQDRKPKEE